MLTQTHKMVLRTLASVIEEATQEPTDWALIGSSSLQLQGINIVEGDGQSGKKLENFGHVLKYLQ